MRSGNTSYTSLVGAVDLLRPGCPQLPQMLGLPMPDPAHLADAGLHQVEHRSGSCGRHSPSAAGPPGTRPE